jgi:hypothetical protein
MRDANFVCRATEQAGLSEFDDRLRLKRLVQSSFFINYYENKIKITLADGKTNTVFAYDLFIPRTVMPRLASCMECAE